MSINDNKMNVDTDNIIAFQGEMGAHSHNACKQMFPHMAPMLAQHLKMLLTLWKRAKRFSNDPD